ncbi:MAG: hypothetical protein JWO31_2002 [Phycisphaerales bacterium]|nr:hypothetical protein [Phycisphaerales bacterium]
MPAPPPRLDYRPPDPAPARPTAVGYVAATLGAMFVFACVLCAAAVAVMRLPDRVERVGVAVAFVLAFLAAASSFRGSVRCAAPCGPRS